MLSALHSPSGLLFSEYVAFFMTVACGKNMTTMIKRDLEEGTGIYILLKIIIPSLLFHVDLLICDVGKLPHSTSEQNELCIWLCTSRTGLWQ